MTSDSSLHRLSDETRQQFWVEISHHPKLMSNNYHKYLQDISNIKHTAKKEDSFIGGEGVVISMAICLYGINGLLSGAVVRSMFEINISTGHL
jgi:acetyl-CoA carboxylase beta subunit